MANNTSAFNPVILASSIQEILDKAHVGRAITSFGLEAQLTKGSTIDRPYVGNLVANDYDDSTGATAQSLTPCKESLVVNYEKEVDFYVSRKDLLQNKFSTAQIYTKRAAYALRDVMDTALLAEVLNASSKVDAGDVGGSAGSAITLTTSNIITVFAKAFEKLQEKNVEDEGDLVAVISPAVFAILQEKAVGAGFNTADKAIANGKVGQWMNFEIFISNNLNTSSSRTHCFFGKKGAVDMVVQSEPYVDEQTVAGKNGKNYLVTNLYGIKTFKTGKDMIVDVQIA